MKHNDQLIPLATALASPALRAIREHEEYMAELERCREAARAWEINEDLMIEEARGLAAATTMSITEALGAITDRLQRSKKQEEALPRG